MASFLFRNPRIETNLVMQVGLQEISNGKMMPEQLTTTVVSFSHAGACLILYNLDVGGKHLFFTTLNSDQYHLFLRPAGNQDDMDETIITAQSIWMDSCEHEGKYAFKIGVQFLQKQTAFFKRLKRGEFS